MILSISNIAWSAENDSAVLALMKQYRYSGLEIAPTRIFPCEPYSCVDEAKLWSHKLEFDYGLRISSMQSIWFGRQENIFSSDEERKILLDYTKQAIDFAEAIHCGNLVFGCPRNRNIPDGKNADCACSFFSELGEYALKHNTVIGLEANPTIYNTNFINNTAAAISLIKEVNCNGFKLNLDVGTMIYNEENLSLLKNNVGLINHVHISEPMLRPIKKRTLHKELADLLKHSGYSGFISVEMGKVDNIQIIEDTAKYVVSVFS